jgi:hypothetical protein
MLGGRGEGGRGHAHARASEAPTLQKETEAQILFFNSTEKTRAGFELYSEIYVSKSSRIKRIKRHNLSEQRREIPARCWKKKQKEVYHG